MLILSNRYVDFFVQCLFSFPEVEYGQGISVLFGFFEDLNR